MKQLNLELVEIFEWFILGVHLDVPESELRMIQYDPKLHRIQDFKTELFSNWMQKLPGPSWSRLVKALLEIGRETLARKIALKYGKTLSPIVLYI